MNIILYNQGVEDNWFSSGILFIPFKIKYQEGLGAGYLQQITHYFPVPFGL
jgi:hypothetical protein